MPIQFLFLIKVNFAVIPAIFGLFQRFILTVIACRAKFSGSRQICRFRPMERIIHKNHWLRLMPLLSLLVISCQKGADPGPALPENPAVVQAWRYPCGPTCTADAWVLVLPDGQAYEAPNLPPNFRKEEQPVLVQFRKTGQKNSELTGTGLEIVSILKIRPR